MSTNNISGTTAADTLAGTSGTDSIIGYSGSDSIVAGAGNDTILGGAGNDTVDGGSGYNTYVEVGTADNFYWSVNSSGQVILTDAVVDASNKVDGSDEGVDTLTNIQAIQYVLPDGTVESTQLIDDYGNSSDAGNYQIQYGVWVTGRANFYGDVDYFKLQTTAGQKVVVSMGTGSTWGYLPEAGSQYSLDGNWASVFSGDQKILTWSSTSLKDIYFRSEELSSNSPMSSKGYSFIFRRELDGTDGADSLVGGDNYEKLVGGLGNDTLTGSSRSDYLDGGDGNDVLTGSGGNDQLDGGAGTANVAVFSGKKGDYSFTWTGGNLSLTITDNVAGRDGTDTLSNLQVLRFTDGDVKLDSESNVALTSGLTQIGQSMDGTLPVTIAGTSVDVDYFRLKLGADISTSTALRISVKASNSGSYTGNLYFSFLAVGSSDTLTFSNLGSSGTINQFSAWLNPGSQQSWIVSPKYWGSSSDYEAKSQLADVRVEGYIYSSGASLGDLAGYTIKVDRILFGTTGSDTISGDGSSGYIDARAGNDSVSGSSIDEQIVGGAGDDTIYGVAGNDTLVDSEGHNSLFGGAGDDTVDVSGSGSPMATIDGGDGIDTLRIASDTDWSLLNVTGVEILDGNSGRTALSPEQVAAKGFTAAQNIIFRLAPSLSTGGSLDASQLSGSFDLRGTNQSDKLTGNAGDNKIYLNPDEAVGSGYGVDTVVAGDGNDTIVWSTSQYQQWSLFFSNVDLSTKTYKIQGELDGGTGTDSLLLHFANNYWYHPWGNTWDQASSPAWRVDLTGLTLKGIESLVVDGYDAGRFWAFPSEFVLTAEQIASLDATSGFRAVSVVGGGTIDLSHFESIGITSWRLGDSNSYEITGTDNADCLTIGAGLIEASLGSGNDEFIIDSKALVLDTLDGGAGSDTLTIRGTDVDLSGATLSGIESIRVSAQSLSMTEKQWADLGGIVSRISGASTGYILSITTEGTTTLGADSPYVGLTGSSGDDHLIGNAANNILVGGAGSDVLTGNGGDDRLVSGDGIDTLNGGDGNDTLVVTDKISVRDHLDGGAGTDTLQVSDKQDFSAATLSGLEVLKGSGTVTMTVDQLAGFTEVNGVTVQLAGASSSFALNASTLLTNGAKVLLPLADSTISNSEGIVGSKGDDAISGNAGNNLIYGGRGADYIDGGAGNDTFVGGSGVDTLAGGTGDDRFDVQSNEFTLDWQTIYSDHIDGGAGYDTLNIEFYSHSGSTYRINAGTVSNLEKIAVTGAGYSTLYLPVDQWRALESFSADSSYSKWNWLSLTIAGDGGSATLAPVETAAKIRSLYLSGTYTDIDASKVTFGPVTGYTDKTQFCLSVDRLDSIVLSAGDDALRVVGGDQSFSVSAGTGNDWVYVSGVSKLSATIDGGAGTDTVDVSGNGYVDLTGMVLKSVESVYYGTSTILVTAEQLASWGFDGSGAKYTKVGDVIVGTDNNDSYSGNGTGSFQGGKGNDTISNVETAVFTGNYADYSTSRSGNTLTVKQERGSLSDGTDTVTGVMKLKFADLAAPIEIDDAPNDAWSYAYTGTSFDRSMLVGVQYGKHFSAKKDYASDTDVFKSTLAPNSPLAIDGSSFNGNNWSMNFYDVATGQQLQFKSLVYGSVNWNYSSWMSAAQKWLPGFNTADGFVPYQGGDVVFQVNVDGGIQDYAFTLNFLDDYAGGVDTLGAMDAQLGLIRGYIGESGDTDWIRTQLIAGTKYEFQLKGVSSGGGTLLDPKLQLLDSAGRLVETGFDATADSIGLDDSLIFRPSTTGTYYLAVTDVAKLDTGSWTLTQQSLDTIAGNVSTTARIEWSGANTFTVSSEINTLSDHDWFRIWLDKGVTYSLRALGASEGGTLADPQLSLRSVTGILLAQDDNGGGGTDAKLVYSASDSGWYFLDAGASGNAGKGTYVLKGSTLADDYSNDLATTGSVKVGTPLQGLVSYNGDSDWVKVGLSAGKTYVIDLMGDTSDSALLDPLADPLLVIHDAAGKVLYRADDFGGSLNARAYFTPTSDGSYYLEARSAFKYDIGAYQLSVSLAPADDAPDVPGESAKTLTLGSPQSGTIGIPGDRDLFKVVFEANKVYQINVEGLSGHAGTLVDPYLRVFDGSGHLVDFDNNSGTGNDAQLYLSPSSTGTYYIEASSDKDRGMGTYEVTVAQRDVPPDDVPDNSGTKVFVNPGDSFAGNLLTHNDQDWFGIKLLKGKDYVFRVQASDSGHGTLSEPVLEIRAADGTLVKTADKMLTTNEPATSFTPLSDGTYYLVVKASDGQIDTGTYTLVTRAPDDYSNTKSGATSISLNETLDGAIQWSDGAYGVRAYDSIGLATDFDEDWFKFSATKEQVLSVNVKIAQGSSLSRPMVEVVDDQGHSFAVGDGLESADGLAVATFKAAATGTYYARVIDGAGATGAYTINLAAGDASDEDSSAPVSLDFVSTGSVVQAQTTAKIGLTGDIDTFTVALQQGHSYRIETMSVRDGVHAPLTSAVLGLTFKAAGAATGETVTVAHDAASPSFFDSTRFDATSSGLMTIVVNPISQTETGQYKLNVVDLGANVVDDRPDTVAAYNDTTHGVMASNDTGKGRIDSASDVDLFAITLTAGNIYDLSIKGYADALGTLAHADLRLLDNNGLLVTSGTWNGDTGRTGLAVSVFQDGRYYIAVSAADLPGNTGTYVLDTSLRSTGSGLTDDMSADTRSGVTVSPGKPASGKIDYAGDLDWVKASLEAGKVYVIDLLAAGNGAGGTLKDSTLRLLDSAGNEVAFDDNSGAELDSHIQFTPTASGDYYLEIGANGTETGTYTARLRQLYGGVADPLKSGQWYLDAIGLDKLDGQITGAGVKVGVVDEGIDPNNPDLKDNLLNLKSLAYDTQFDTANGDPKYPVLVGMPPDNHGTAVAGIIAAVGNNETGIVGIAPDAELVSTRVKWSYDQITQALGLQWQFDVSNNSWGATSPFGDNFNSTTLTFAYQALRTGVDDGRDGLGTVFVFSAGNSAAYGDNTNYHNFQNAREVITVGAVTQDGSAASFSTSGANVLVGAYGVGLLTTDRVAGLGYEAGNYTTFSGTSAAAPVVSGVVALMLEANPHLGYRDVQEILACTSSHPDSQSWKTNAAYNLNLGGMKFNDSIGFGIVDAYAAVTLAETWTKVSTAVNEVSDSARAFDLKQAIPDGDGTAYTKTFTIDNAIKVEHVELGVDLTHTRLGDLIVELISPNGTVSTLMDRPTVNAEQPVGLSGSDSGVPTHLLWDFSSVQFWGEEAVGDWKVVVKDVRAEETGTLNSLSLRVYGEKESGNDVYVFTEEGFQHEAGRVLSDESGHDTINASPMLHDTYVDLHSGVIAAESVTYAISSWTVIEDVITGSGNDRLVGNDADNLLEGRGGNDTFTGGPGSDTIIGGAGSDTVIYTGSMSEFKYSWQPDTKQLTVVDGQLSNGNEGTDVLEGIERIVFSDGELNLGSVVGNHAPQISTKLFDSPVVLPKSIGIDYELPSTVFSDPDGNTQDLSIQVTSATGGELPDWLSYDASTGKLTGVPPQDMQGQVKLLVKAIDDFGASASDLLTLQFGDNQAPVLDTPGEKVINEDAGLVSLGITAPVDPEGKDVTITILDVPTIGAILDGLGHTVVTGATLTSDQLSQLHYQTATDANGDAGYLKYLATDADKVTSESFVHLYVSAVNDAPAFATASGKLVIQYPSQSTVHLDMLHPVDPESTITTVHLTELPALGTVLLDGTALKLDQVLTMDQIDHLSFTLSENVNGPVGKVTIEAVDPQGLATNWSLALEVQGDAWSNVGTAGNDSIYGSIGNDTLYGMGGDDLLVGNAGLDRLLGGLGNDSLFGGSGNDVLDGSSGNDYLDGGSGSDTMSGGPGHDTYVVDSQSDQVLEVISGGAGGKDLILTSISLMAPSNVENLQAASGFAIDLTGNALDNILVGNETANTLSSGGGRDTLIGGDGNDSLDGGAGVDKLAGGKGDDIYHVDSKFDVVVELTGEGADVVHAACSFTLPSNVEHLFLDEGGDYNAGGNSLDNHLVGNSGNNILAGGLGHDMLEGGLGDDIYVLSDLFDTIVDTGGNDTIRTSLDVTLIADIENAELIGVNDTSATGNTSNNRLVGNAGDNIIDGMGGVDTLTGGDGSDQFIVRYNGKGIGPDHITDFTPGKDLLVIDPYFLGLTPSQIGLSSGTVSDTSIVRGAGAVAVDSDDFFLLDTARGVLMFDLDGSGATAAVDLVKFVGVGYETLTGADIYVAV